MASAEQGSVTEVTAAVDGHDFSQSSAGTFRLRRARYLAEAEMLHAQEQLHGTLADVAGQVDADIRHRLIVQNLRMVLGVARRYTDRGLELVDLVRAGNQALIQAMEHFDPDGRRCFSSFAIASVSRNIELALLQLRQGDRRGHQGDRRFIREGTAPKAGHIE